MAENNAKIDTNGEAPAKLDALRSKYRLLTDFPKASVYGSMPASVRHKVDIKNLAKFSLSKSKKRSENAFPKVSVYGSMPTSVRHKVDIKNLAKSTLSKGKKRSENAFPKVSVAKTIAESDRHKVKAQWLCEGTGDANRGGEGFFDSGNKKPNMGFTIASMLVGELRMIFAVRDAELYVYDKALGYYKSLARRVNMANSFDAMVRKSVPLAVRPYLTTNVTNEAFNWLVSGALCNELPKTSEHLVNLSNGVLNLLTGELCPHSPEFGFTNRVNANYDEYAVLGEASAEFFGNLGGENYQYLMAALGLGISNYRALQKAAFIYGQSGNGKSTLARFIRDVVPPDSFAGLSFTDLGNAYATANLEHASISVCTDSAIGKPTPKAIARFKQIVGGDAFEAQAKGIQHRTIDPRCMLMFISNFPIKIPSHDDPAGAVRRRMWMIETGPSVPADQRNPAMNEILQNDATAIVSTALKAAMNIIKNPTLIPECEADLIYEREIFDPDSAVSRFVDEELCFLDDLQHGLPMQEVYKTFCEFWGEEYRDALSYQGFAARIKKFINGVIKKNQNRSTLFGYDWKNKEDSNE